MNKYMKIVKLSFIERISNAFVNASISLFLGLAAIIIAPLVFIYSLFIKEKHMIDVNLVNNSFDNLANPPIQKSPDDGEDWKKKHFEEYGDGS